ncbi:hypothetical protein GH742_04230 [Legionella sp. MW5194]|uniref:hypothetical protein n=1 Tax=Legionella sp. MW5194 TaxID=2662448 RepID=UPI00193CB627|nr:hypothetical protein [Legionella sp. MW5194]QRN03134.1 hypothetical protein GH742_04230 [Legionella sp. MW5194]
MFSFFDFEAICFDTNNAHAPTARSMSLTDYEKGIEYAEKIHLKETVLGLGDEGDGSAIITSGSHPDFVAGCFAAARGKRCN